MSAPSWVGTSWKMHKTLAEAEAFAAALLAAERSIDPAIQPFVIPPFTAVRQVKAALAATRIKVGAQNMHWEDAGAWTGEISPPMLAECGVDLVEIGHSERRQYFGETDHTVGLKVAAAQRHGLLPLVCVGETLAERDAGRADEVLARQVAAALQFLDLGGSRAILFAYEPVWAIGVNGMAADATYADARQRLIGERAAARLGARPAVLYGGSVNAGNAAELIGSPHVDGLFIGRAAWQAAGFIDILTRVSAVLRG